MSEPVWYAGTAKLDKYTKKYVALINIANAEQYDSHVYYRRETLKRDYMFGIHTNYHCFRFTGSGVMQGSEIAGSMFFCTRMYEYFLRSWMCFRVSHFCK